MKTYDDMYLIQNFDGSYSVMRIYKGREDPTPWACNKEFCEDYIKNHGFDK